MDFKIDSKILINKLYDSVSICKSSFHEDYKYISIESFQEKQEIIITSFNIELVLVHKLKAQVSKSGKVVVLAKQLLSIIEHINLSQNEEIKFFSKTNLKIETKNKSCFCLAITDNSVVDIIPDFDKEFIKISPEDFYLSLKKASILCKKDSEKIYELGLNIENSQNGTVFVSLNNHSISISKMESFSWPEYSSFISTYAVECILKLMTPFKDNIYIHVSSNFLEFKYEESFLTINTMQVKFPNYKSVIPKSGFRTLILNRKELIRNLDIALTYNEDIIANLTLINSELSLEFNSVNDGQSISYLKVDKNSTIDRFSAKFSCSILKSLLEAHESEFIKFEIRNKEDPFIIRGDKNYIQLMMLRK